MYYNSEKVPLHWLNKKKAFVASIHSLNTSYVPSLSQVFASFWGYKHGQYVLTTLEGFLASLCWRG